jgi:hypothetical protein
MSKLNALVNAEIQRLMVPKKYSFIVTINYSHEVTVLAVDEEDAIDIVLSANPEDVRVLNCNDVEIRA